MFILDMVDVCNDLAVLRTIKFIKNLLEVIRVLVPIILIIMCIIDFCKALFAGEDKQITSTMIKRFMSAIIIFFIVPVVNMFFELLGESHVDTSECWNNANDSNIETLAANEEAKLQAEKEEQSSKRKQIQEERNKLLEQLDASRLSLINNQTQTNNTGNLDDVNNPLLSAGGRIVAYAKQFVGNKYKYGGTNPYINDWSIDDGIDCSGFVQFVYKQNGINLPRDSRGQSNVGTAINGIENAKAGDLIFYAKGGTINHVAIYMGGNKVIHASSAKTGIKITDNASYRTIAAIRRVIN